MMREQIERVFSELEKAGSGEFVKDTRRLSGFLENRQRLLLLKPKMLRLVDQVMETTTAVAEVQKQAADIDRRLARLEKH